MIIDHTRLRNFAHRIVAAGGSSPEEAASVADHLIEANLRGHDSHGVGMLVAYVRDFEAGTLNAGAGEDDFLEFFVIRGLRGRGQSDHQGECAEAANDRRTSRSRARTRSLSEHHP